LPTLGASLAFEGTERFVLERRIGEGGMGVVYRAWDRQSALPVALKTMAYVEPAALLRFKNEFRALADISHPNVVQLYELVAPGERWFFTMELLDGVDFLRWVRHEEPERACDVQRLRPALLQLINGVSAIHAAGKLHRDIKPSNVMVTQEGRVVLLDFGVVGDQQASRHEPRGEDQILGTPAYMAPEQACGVAPAMAADWYAVGVIVYEALTGRLPFDGSPHEILFGKQGNHAAPPSDLVPGVPADLDALCLDLLHPDPRKRPRGEDVLQRVSFGKSAGLRAPRSPAPSTLRPFVGRKMQLDALGAAFQRSLSGGSSVVLLAGRSGMGKTVLAQRFLAEAGRAQNALVLSGRCFEREALPFKGMDSVVDELSRYLAVMLPHDVQAVLPAGLHYLTRVFPVLRTVPGIATAALPKHEIVEPIELRKRAFAALKELLRAVGARQPMILHIDDVQWSDVDSLVLLEHVMQPPDAPNMLLICAYREEGRHQSPVLAELFAVLARLPSIARCELSVAQLSAEEAAVLAQSSLDPEQHRPSELAHAIALEAQGVPIFVSELAQWQLERSSQPQPWPARDQPWSVSIERVIQRRVTDLPLEASRLLEVVSVANGPLSYRLVEQTAGVSRNDALRARLRAARLVRTFRTTDGEEYAEAYHARVRDSVVATLSVDQLGARHATLARVLEASGTADPEALVEHYLAAGDRERARLHVLAAAETAERGLAFMRAARLYRTALQIGVDRPRHELLICAANALVHAGRSSDAAEAYGEAAQEAPAYRALELKRRAAEHYLKSGRDREGLAALRSVLKDAGLGYRSSSGGALASLVYHRARARLRGLNFRASASGDCRPRDLNRVDVAFAATSGLAMVDVIRGADYGAQHLRLALDVGEPIRICRALAFEAGHAAAVGAGSRDRIERLVQTAQILSLRSEDPHGTALAKIAAGLVRVFSGEWRAARAMLDEAEVLLRERCRGVTWELTNTQAWSQNALILCGDLPEAAARMPVLMREATERSDRYALMHMIYPACITALAANDVDAGWHVASDDSSFRACEPDRFTAGHWGRLISTQSVHRYRGEGSRARAFVAKNWSALEASHFLRVHLMRVFSEFERGLSSISAMDEGARDAASLRAAERSVKRVSRDSPRYAKPMGHYLAGCLAAACAKTERALDELQCAALGLQAVDMGYLALCARHRCAELLAGDDGRTLARQCREQFVARGVVNVEACLAMSAPGFRRLTA
jgi:eukaryotic-like serine/threonine-protein kinase